jgi:DNA-binding transcriptional MocR family regulator
LQDVLITCAELALLKGVSKASVSKALQSGRISGAVVMEGGKRMLDRDKALQLWDQNTRRGHHAPVIAPEAPKRGQLPAPPAPPARDVADELKRLVANLPDDQIPDLYESRGRKEHYQAELAKLQVAQQRKELVSAEDVKKEAFTMGRAIRDGMMNIPDRLSAQVAAISDPREVHRVMTEEIRVALRMLADG